MHIAMYAYNDVDAEILRKIGTKRNLHISQIENGEKI